MSFKLSSTNNKILKNSLSKNSIQNLIKEYQEDFSDILVIFVTEEGDLDLYWSHLSNSEILNILSRAYNRIKKLEVYSF